MLVLDSALTFFAGYDVRSQLASALLQDGLDVPSYLQGDGRALKDARGAHIRVGADDALDVVSGDRTWERAAAAVKELHAKIHADSTKRKREGSNDDGSNDFIEGLD